jgi:hypothetical protein
MNKDIRGALALQYQYDIHRCGKLVYKSRPKLAESFLIAYAKIFYMKIIGSGVQTIKDTGGTDREIVHGAGMDSAAAAANTLNGLVVGTGTDAVTINDHQLQTKIAHGTGSGQLDYGASVVNLPSSDATSTSLILTRVFSNASGGTVTIREFGIYVSNLMFSQANSRQLCIMRDVATIALLNGDQLTLNYILKTVV